MIRVMTDGGGATHEPQASSSTKPTPHPTTPSPGHQATRAALRNYAAGKTGSKNELETALWHEALSSASSGRLINSTAAYTAERGKLQQEYGSSLPKGMTRAGLDSVWASTVANARANSDQAPTTRALLQYGQAKLAERPKDQSAPKGSVT